MDLMLSGRSALVSGSSSGIGTAIAAQLAREGAVVLVHGRDEASTRDVAGRLRREGGEAHAVIGSLDSDEGADRVAKAAEAAVGRIDVLVNNVGSFEASPWGQGPASRWLDVFNHVAVSAVRLIERLTPAMRKAGWGRVIQISSVSATLAPPVFPDYAAAKASLLNITRSLSQELGGTGVTVNTVSPGPIVTPSWERFAMQIASLSGWDDDLGGVKARLLDGPMANPSNRLGEPSDVAAAVAFLASPLAGFVNGANLPVDGGLSGGLNR